ncbi:MAG: hypothetical protein A2Z46_01870 [Nitrospirae bacterium RBG_19FT_COMBO_55_12]|nr:MAG: hypothetical protein A2Z46_01870 [Nitrospirae bacterium RBG_19FT_COMBO_55_12]
MNLTSEQVHWIIGGWIAIIACFLILNETRVLAARWVRWLLPVGMLAVGIELIIDPLLHGAAAPGGYEHETAQHFMLGAGLIVVAALEGLREKEVLRHRFWSMVMPTGLIAAGAVFMFHAQHEASVPIIVLIAQHRVYGVTLWLAGLAKALAEIRSHKTRTFAAGWLVLLLLFGFELLLYTEGGSLFGESFLEHSGHMK